MNNSNLVSIIIPAHNAEKTIRRCIDSVLEQDYKKIEVIVVDDGSNDNTLSVLKNIGDPRVRVFEEEHFGVSHARNVGLSKCSGNYVMFMDSDDAIDHNTISSLLKYMIENNDVDVVKFGYRIIKERIKMAKEMPVEFCDRVFHTANKDDKASLIDLFFRNKNTIPCYSVTLFFKKNFLDRTKLHYNEKLYMMEDAVFYLDLFNNDVSFRFVADPFYNYYYNLGSVTRTRENYIHIARGALMSTTIILNELAYPAIASGKYFRIIFEYIAKNVCSAGELNGMVFSDDLRKIALAADFKKHKLFWGTTRMAVVRKNRFMVKILSKIYVFLNGG